jgi:iron complex outermembrane recepter protein
MFISIHQYLRICIVIILFSPFSLQAQTCNHVIRGRIVDAETKEAIAYATVFVKETKAGAMSNEQGFYNIDHICNGTFTLEISHVACVHETRQVHIHDEGAIMDFALHHHEGVDLQEISISAQAIEAKKTQANATLEGAALSAARGLSLGDALKNIAGVTTLNTGATIAKPVIQGLHSNRILMYNNGVRQEGQQWGLDHAPEIDPATADKLTVVKGAASVIYGADAIGGVVLIEPKVMRWREGIGGKVNLAGLSNGQVGVASLRLEGCQFCHTDGFSMDDKRKFAWRVQGSLKRGGNLKTPNYFLANTGILERNLSAQLDHKSDKVAQSVYYSQFFTQIGIFSGAHIGNIEDLKRAFQAEVPLVKADFSYQLARPLQKVTHHLLKYKNTWQLTGEERLTTQLSWQRNQRGEFDKHRLFGTLPSDTKVPNIAFDLNTLMMNSTLEHHLSEKVHGKLGAELIYQNNLTERGGLIPNFVSTTTAAFLTERWHRYDSPWEAEMGLRYDYKWLNVRVRNGNPEGEGNLQQFHFQSFAGQIGLIRKWRSNTFFSYNFGSAWRAPSVNELFSLGVHHGTASYERGNANLQSERSLNNTFSVSHQGEHLKIQLDLYSNFIQNFIYLKPDSVPVLTIRGAFPAFNYAQTNALLQGIDLFLDWQFYKNWHIETKGAYLKADNLSEKLPLILMPANRISCQLKYDLAQQSIGNILQLQNSTFAFGTSHVFEQKRVPPNQDFAAPPKAYTLLNMAITTTFLIRKQAIEAHLQINNLTNVAYRDYLNRFRYFADEVGRDVQLKLQYVF